MTLVAGLLELGIAEFDASHAARWPLGKDGGYPSRVPFSTATIVM